LNNNDVISVVMTSNAACLATTSATSSNVTMTITNLPGQPGSIIGNTNACVGSTQTYQVTAAGGATSYIWSFPSGWIGTSTTNSISVSAGTEGGPITVTPVNGCGNGSPQQTTVTPTNVPAQPGLITGNTSFCQGNSLSYSITAVNGASSYSWSLPEGWTGNSSTTSISAIAGSASGNISVSANNTCGNSTAQTLAVNAGNAPAQPEAITGNTSYCPGESLQYSIPPVSGAISYSWTTPTGWTGTSTTNSISTISSTAGTISVAANGTCGSSVAQTLNVAPVALPAQPTLITGNATVCNEGAATYSIDPVVGANTYVWTLSGGISGTSSSTLINVFVSGNGGTISVAGQNTCLQNGTPQTLAVLIPQLDTSFVVNGTELIANAIGVEYQWLDCGNSFEPIEGATEAQFSVPNIGSYALRVSQDGCSATSSCVDITVVGKERVQAEKGITIYPNPSHDRITISTEKPVEISIFNALGGLIDRFELNGSRELYIGNLANGVYFLQTNNQGNYRIVKH
jgi:large repetitive protein